TPSPTRHGSMCYCDASRATRGQLQSSHHGQFAVSPAALPTAGDVVVYGPLEGYLKACEAKSGKDRYKFKTSSCVIGNVMTYTHKGKQHLAILSGVGGWAGIGLAAG
ncbi:PQQ-dependent dehydrogenase, methanol/ethanol family, partial [Methylobacterium sp. J-078]|nr:PQQ-dependent dehydrogenase, methanol/ethanol family [Methylobacterium sp. J-078]